MERWQNSSEGVRHVVVDEERTTDGTIVQGTCGTWFVPVPRTGPNTCTACLTAALELTEETQ